MALRVGGCGKWQQRGLGGGMRSQKEPLDRLRRRQGGTRSLEPLGAKQASGIIPFAFWRDPCGTRVSWGPGSGLGMEERKQCC